MSGQQTIFKDKLQHLQTTIDAVDDDGKILQYSKNDVASAINADLYVLPIVHHSVASAIKTQQILEQREPEVIFLEFPSDLQEMNSELQECQLPVAFQGISSDFDNVDPMLLPFEIKVPLTEFSAEYQAIQYAQQNDTKLIFVDLPCEDHLMESATSKKKSELIIEPGDIKPSRGQFISNLLEQTNSPNFSEFWVNHMESSLLSASLGEYRFTMYVIGSIFRRLGIDPSHEQLMLERDKNMWAQISTYFNENQELDPDDTLYVCGASHAVPIANQFGKISTDSTNLQQKPSTPKRKWHYGIIETSFSDIDEQFYDVPGTTVEQYQIWNTYKGVTSKENISIQRFNHDKLLRWAIDIVKLAREEGYTTSTADSIAIVEIYYRLANLRGRSFLSKVDFMEAVKTCIVKEDAGLVQLSEIFNKYFRSSDRRGSVGFTALSPLAKDVIERLSEEGFDYDKNRIQRFLFDFEEEPEKREISDLLWILHKLDVNVTPIMGNRELTSSRNLQESWDIYIARNVNPLNSLGYEGLTVEEVLRKRLMEEAEQAESALSLTRIIKDAILYLSDYQQLHQKLIDLLVRSMEDDIRYEDNLKFFQEINLIINYYRGKSSGIPNWLKKYILNAYKIYCKELPKSFSDKAIGLKSLAGILTFILKFESIVLSEGGDRSEFQISLELSKGPDLPPEREAMFIVVESIFDNTKLNELRRLFYNVYSNQMTINKLPLILEGLFYSMYFAPNIGSLVAELLDQCFRNLENKILARWIPSIIQLFDEIDDKLIGEIRKLILDTYQNKPVSLWYDLDAYETGNFKQLSLKQDEKQSQKIETTPMSIITKYRAATNYTTQLLGLEGSWNNEGQFSSDPPSTLIQEFKSASNQVLQILDIPINWGMKTAQNENAVLVNQYNTASKQVLKMLNSKNK